MEVIPIALFGVSIDIPFSAPQSYAQAQFDVLDLSTHKQTHLSSLAIGPPARAAAGFDVSPDRRQIICTRVDALESDIMLVENFH